jgi:hypothetical protein
MWMGLVAMNVWTRPELALADRFARALHIVVVRSRERAHRRVAHRRGDRLDGLEVPRARRGEARLDHVHAKALELQADAHLLLLRHRRAGALLAVAHGGVEDDQLVLSHGKPPNAGWTRPPRACERL